MKQNWKFQTLKTVAKMATQLETNKSEGNF